MNEHQWFNFFRICAENLGVGHPSQNLSENWCSWITFDRLNEDCRYWASGLPSSAEIQPAFIGDGGIWGQPFSYNSIAHIILPKKFYCESSLNGVSKGGFKCQDVELVSRCLAEKEIPHSVTNLVLEIKLY